jgi:alpha-tubulin suppressor-like RCC1 family protein
MHPAAALAQAEARQRQVGAENLSLRRQIAALERQVMGEEDLLHLAPLRLRTPAALSRAVFIGYNSRGQCTLPNDELKVPAAAPRDCLPGGRRVVAMGVGGNFTLLLADNSQLYAVGRNDRGQLGRGHDTNDRPENHAVRPVTGFGTERITLVAAGYYHCAAVTEGGKLFMWGQNDFGQCGTGTIGGAVLAATRCGCGALADAGVRVVFVACGGAGAHTVAVTGDGGVIAFGANVCGQLGTGNNDHQPTPERLACAALAGVRIVGCAAGDCFAQLMSDDGRVFAMGKNNHGQLGTGDTTNVNTPTEIDAAHFGGAPVAAVSCGGGHTMAITRGEGKLYCWGVGSYGATGLEHARDATTPQPATGALADARVVRIAAGMGHSCVLTEDGRWFAFGLCAGIPAAGQQGIVQLLAGGALAAGMTVRALATGSSSMHAASLSGTPPGTPAFDTPLCPRYLAWLRRRTLLLCLLRAGGHGGQPSSGGGATAATVPAAAAAGDGEVLLRVASLPEELWQGPLIFQFL